MKSFGPKTRKTPIERVPFEFTVMRDDEPEVHEFVARAITDTAALAFTLSSTNRHPERALTGMLRLIGKMLDNKDGTPVDWAPTPLPFPAEQELDALDVAMASELDDLAEPEVDADGETVRKFRGPDGELYPMGEAAQFLKPEAGSSRRRWRALMEDDEEAVVDGEALSKLFEWMIGLAAGRPTRPSS